MLAAFALTLTAHALVTGADPASVDCGWVTAYACDTASDCPEGDGMQCSTGPGNHDLCDGHKICWRYAADLRVPSPPSTHDPIGWIDGPGHWLLSPSDEDGDPSGDRFGLTLDQPAELSVTVAGEVWVDVYERLDGFDENITATLAAPGQGYTLSLPAGTYELLVHGDDAPGAAPRDVQVLVQ